MSTGLMSCVRENSPPLEMSGSESGALSLPSSGAEPQQKRRRFHPLRNLRRIFRRRTMTSVDSPAISPVSSPSSPSSSQLSSTPTVIASVPAHSLSTYCKSSTTPGDVTMSSTAYPPHLIGLSGGRGGGIVGGGNCAGVAIVSPFSSSASASSGFYIKDIREHSDNVFKLKESSANDLDDNREMTDCQRSFSEGRLVDSDFSRDGLSQSHDSVFSESATASSLSILKAELFDVLRKRRNRPDASDEDLGLPRSPTTPQRKDQTIKSNQSEVSSLSLLSMASSDLDDDYGLGERTTSSVSSKISPDTSRNSDEIDFVISIGSRLSHSAARHKMAVRPKKKGPTRHRRPIESTILPSTPEVNEEILKVTLDVKDITEKGKSHSLPPGVNAKILEQHSHDSNITKEATNSHIKRSKTEKVTSPTGAYSVRNISSSSSSTATTTAASTSTIEAELHSSSSINSMFDRKEDEGGFFRRLLLRNSKKNKKNTDESDTIKSDDSQATSTTTISGIESSSSYRTYEKTEAEFIHSSSRVEETRKEIRKEILSEAKSSLSAMLNTFILSPDHETDPEPQPPPALVHQQQQNIPKVHKPKSGPAARQRFIPKDLTNSPLPDIKIADMSTTTTTASTASSQFIAEEKDSNNKTSVILQYPPIKAKPEGIEVPKIMSFKSDVVSGPQGDNQNVVNKLDKSENTAEALMTGSRMAKSLTEDNFRSSTTSVKETLTTSATVEHYEKRERTQPKIVGLSPFMQKMTRSEPFTLDSTHPVPKQRKSVEKSKSFRYYSENTSKDDIENGLKKHENMPSLPDLSYPRKISSEIAGCNKQQQQQYQQLTQQQKQLPLAFEINDNNLIKLHRDEEPLPLSQGIYTKNIILTTTQKPLAPLFTSSSSSTAINVPKPLASPTCNQNITEIEENIDKLLIKSPFLTVLKKSSLLDENNCENNTKISNSSNNSSSFSSSNIINSTSNMTNKNATKISVTSIRRIDDFDNNNKIVEQFQATSTTIAAAAGGGNTKLIEKDVESKITPISSTVEKLVVNDEKQSSKLFGLEKSTSLEMLISDEKSSSAKLIIGGGGNTNEKKQSTTTTTEQKVLNEISSSTIDNAINKVELRKDSCNKSVSTTNKARRNSSVLEKFDNSSSNHVPEFMKIQLNRVESTRPKSNIVLSKNAKDSDDSSKIESTRRYSNESVELTDTKPPIPPAVAELVPLSNKRSSGTPAGTELPVSSKRISATTTSTPTTISSTAITSTTISSSQSKSLSDDELKSPKAVKKVDDDNTILRNTENTLQQQHQQTIQTHQTIVFERRKSVTEEKLKYEKKVEELKLLEKKKPTVVLPSPTPPPPPAVAPPSSDDNNTRLIDSRKMSIDDETGVVLRKKSFALINQSINNNNNKDDSTPELMKVFARRSLKIKDEDIPNIEDLDKTTTTTSTLKKFTNLDSDKENQSSSEEKLDKLPKVEITIQTANKQSKSDDIKTRNSLAEFRKPNITTTTQIQSTTGTPTKSFIQPMRYSSNIVGYRSVSTVFNNKTSSTTTTTQQSTALTPATTNQEQSSTTGTTTTTTVIQQQSNNNNTEQINNNNNNNNSNNNNNNNHYTSSTNSNVNNKKLVGIRHTIGPSTPTTNNSTTTPTTGIIDSKREDSSEFKGILQRRAEWEKRAKEALK